MPRRTEISLADYLVPPGPAGHVDAHDVADRTLGPGPVCTQSDPRILAPASHPRNPPSWGKDLLLHPRAEGWGMGGGHSPARGSDMGSAWPSLWGPACPHQGCPDSKQALGDLALAPAFHPWSCPDVPLHGPNPTPRADTAAVSSCSHRLHEAFCP